MKLKIIADGSRKGSRVVNAETGEEIEGVTGIEWKWSYSDEDHGAIPYCWITVESVPLDAELVNRDCSAEKEVL